MSYSHSEMFLSNKTFTISGSFGCVVDLVGTKTRHHVELSGLKCALKREPFRRLLKKAKDPEDAARLRRLKDLAEKNKHHEAALRFHADEMRAKRWNETGPAASCLDRLFDFFSNYGQSVLRPAAGLALLFIVSFLAGILPADWDSTGPATAKEAAKTALANSLPFLPAPGLQEALPLISCINLPLLSFCSSIGLGLRNRFRI